MLRGAVTDASGAPVGNVTLTIADMDSEYARATVASRGGEYEAPFLKPGRYRVTIEQRGYRSFTATGIEVRAGETRRFDPVLEPGSLAETHETDETAKLAPSERGAVNGRIDYRARWSDAPVVDRRGSALPLLVTGPATQGNGSGLTIAGESSRTRQTWAIDGVPQDTISWTGNPNYFDSVEVTVANGSVASYRPVGFNMVSKRGLDTWHGSAYYRHGSSLFDARPYFDASKTPYRMRETGVELGGALIPKWTYVYGGWTYQHDQHSETLYADVPTAKMRTGDFSEFLNAATAPNGVVRVIRDPRTNAPFPNNVIPGGRMSSVANNLVSNYYPAATATDAAQMTQNYSWTHKYGTEPFTQHWPFFRVDQKIAPVNTAYVRYQMIGAGTVLPGSSGALLDSTQRERLQSYAVADTQVISSSLVNQARFGWISNRVQQGQEEQDVTPLRGDSVVSTVGLQGVNATALGSAGFPSMTIAGLSSLSMAAAGGATENIAHQDRVWTFEETLAWSRGRHAVQVGGQAFAMRWQDGTVPQSAYGAFTFSGAFSGVAFADFLLGLPATATRTEAKVNRPLTQKQGGLFATDSFRATRRLTIDYGVRWDYFGAPRYEDGFMSNWDPATGAVVVAPGTRTLVSTLYPSAIRVVVGDVVPKANLRNFRPRVSAAYRVSENLVVRGGYGEFTAASAFGADGLVSPTNPYWLTETYTNTITNGNAAIAFPKPFPATPTSSQLPSQSVTALPARMDEGVIRQYNVTVERSWKAHVLRLSYIGSRGTGMNYTLDVDKAPASTAAFSNARRPYPLFASTVETRTDGEWRYNAAQAQVRRTAGPVTFESNFTWSSNLANYLNTYDPYHVTDYWSRDGADRRFYWTTSASWRVPNGHWSSRAAQLALRDWSLHVIATAASGQFYTPLFTGADPANATAGFVTQPADCIGDPNAGARTVSRWFNPAAFAAPPSAAGRYGTCGVNSLEGYPVRVGHVSVVKQLPLREGLRAVFTAQISNVTNTAHFTIPNNNISTAGAGSFTAASAVDYYSPERLGYRQVYLKLRLEW